jgi:hypothetical protein
MSDVMSFKMVSGEEVVAELVSTKTLTPESAPLSYTVRRPHILQFQPVGPGQLGLAFVPWTLSNPAIERLEIPASAVLLTFPPADKVERQYLEQTSGISLAGAGMKV